MPRPSHRTLTESGLTPLSVAAAFQSHLVWQEDLCTALDALADRLPARFDTHSAKVLVGGLHPTLFRAHRFEEEVAFPILLAQHIDLAITLDRLQGAALLVLDAPSGAAAGWLRSLIVGTVALPGVPLAITAWMPKARVLLLVCQAAVSIPLRCSKLGLSIYAIGSSELAALRSGVPVARTKVATYAISGLFAAMGGLSLTMSTGIGAPIPGPYLLASVAAVVLGGVTLGGGRGGLAGPIVAVFILRLVRTDLTLLAVNPNVTSIIEGTIMVVVVMFGVFIAMKGRSP